MATGSEAFMLEIWSLYAMPQSGTCINLWLFMVGIFGQLCLTCNRFKYYFPRGHWHSPPIRSLHEGIHVVSDPQHPKLNLIRPLSCQLKTYHGFLGTIGRLYSTIERVRVDVNEYLMVPGISVPSLNRLLSFADSAIVYNTHDFTTGFLYCVFVARRSVGRVSRIVVLRVLPDTGRFLDVEDAYGAVAWRELHRCVQLVQNLQLAILTSHSVRVQSIVFGKNARM